MSSKSCDCKLPGFDANDPAVCPTCHKPHRPVDLAALRTENAKLREALRGMLEWFGKYPEFVPSNGALESGKIDAAIAKARAALA